jgi:hypothetical protein
MVSPNTMSPGSYEATRDAAVELARQVAVIQSRMFKLLLDGAPEQLVRLAHDSLMDKALDEFMFTLMDNDECRIPVPSCN